MGFHAADRATRHEALGPRRQGVRRRFGPIAGNVASGLALRFDHGSQYLNDTCQQELAFPGVSTRPPFVRAPEGNGCTERVIRTLKAQLLRVKTFATVEGLRLALIEWARLYSEQWLSQRPGHRTPAQTRRDFEAAAMALAA